MVHAAPPSDAEAHAAMRRALAAGRIGLWHWDIASDAVLWDGALCAVYGLSAATAPRTAPDFLSLVAPEDRDMTVRTVSRGLEGAAAIQHSFRAVIDGRSLRIYDRAHVIRDRDARPTSVIGMCCDVAPGSAAGITPSPGPLGERQRVDLAAYLATMAESLRRDPRTGAARRVEYQASTAQCAFDHAVRLALILMELVTPVGTAPEMTPDRRIEISLRAGDGSGSLEIVDPHAQSRHPFDDLGLESAATLARPIGGALRLEPGRRQLDFVWPA
jgi:hypothetical protein